jgi:hypothetical protein
MAYSRVQTMALPPSNDQPTTYEQKNRRHVSDVLRMTTNAIRDMAQSTSSIFTDFQGAMKTILPKLNKDEKDLVYAVFGEYHLLLMATQRFIQRTTILVSRAQTTTDLLQSVDPTTVRELVDKVVPLLQRCWGLKSLIDEKVKDERTILTWRNISLGLLGFGASVFIIATDAGFAIGFTAAVKSILLIAGAVSIVGVLLATIAHA